MESVAAHAIDSGIARRSIPHQKHQEEITNTNSTVKAGGTPCQGETLDERCGRLADELAKAEFEQMTNMYQLNASFDAVSELLGPLCNQCSQQSCEGSG